MLSFVYIGPPVLEKKNGSYHILGWRPSWSCDLDYLCTHWFPFPTGVSLIGQAVSEKKIFENMNARTEAQTHGRRLDYHTISSQCEPSAQVS